MWNVEADAIAVIEWNLEVTAEWIAHLNPVQLFPGGETITPSPAQHSAVDPLPEDVDGILKHVATMAAGYSSGLKWNEEDKLKADMMNRPVAGCRSPWGRSEPGALSWGCAARMSTPSRVSCSAVKTAVVSTCGRPTATSASTDSAASFRENPHDQHVTHAHRAASCSVPTTGFRSAGKGVVGSEPAARLHQGHPRDALQADVGSRNSSGSGPFGLCRVSARRQVPMRQASAASPTPSPPARASTPAKSPPSSTPRPSTVKTSGSFEADIKALGIVPDDMGYYTSYLKEGICQQTGIDFAIAVRSIGRDGPATGGGPDVVRLTVAYFCPTRAAAVENELAYVT